MVEKIEVSPNTAMYEFPRVTYRTTRTNMTFRSYRFALPKATDVLGLPIGQHIQISAEISGKEIMRSYTPTSSDDNVGYFDLLIKVCTYAYLPAVFSTHSHSNATLWQAYEKGNISRYVSLLKIGDKIRVKGPKGQFNYTPFLSREIGMIAGGTGITPMVQIIRAALNNPLDETRLSLIYANVGLDDILLKEELDEFAEKYPSRFKVHYVLNNPPEVWTGSVGFVSKDQIEKLMPPAADDIKILMCGPPPMMTAMKSVTSLHMLTRSDADIHHRKYLADLKYPAPRTISKLEDQVCRSSSPHSSSSSKYPAGLLILELYYTLRGWSIQGHLAIYVASQQSNLIVILGLCAFI